jgi:protein-tyrosine phosphatase
MTYRVALVCLGNICRSPMADVVVNHLLEEARSQGADLDVEVTSAGTAGWHVGGPMDDRAAEVLRGSSYDPTRHRAQQFGPGWFDHDLILAMDSSNLAEITAQLPPDRRDRVRLFRSFDPEVTGPEVPDVPDPYYGGDEGFHEVLAMVERTARELVAQLRAKSLG